MKYEFRRFTKDDYEYIYELKKKAYIDYVIANWGTWDENAQREYFKKFVEAYKETMYIITKDNMNIGFYNDDFLENGNYEIGNICIDEKYRGQGIGTKILLDILEKYKNYNIELQYFKQNRVGELYKRLGFVENGETNFHYKMIKFKKDR
ncbi:MAG: GNAT family N-acetyltransferase [Bacilli bacterium]|nr:GNAT family N-acetyltransferase [Bacilli bacterium]